MWGRVVVFCIAALLQFEHFSGDFVGYLSCPLRSLVTCKHGAINCFFFLNSSLFKSCQLYHDNQHTTGLPH
ncbi:hypothetical protein EDC01DRAFT_27357 [Geopyxis carbonaria]|nr:hypothetical protein EDC01DRAFT_27357 [Geopyxis carbonaria]